MTDQSNNEINFVNLITSILDNKWRVIIITFLSFVIGLGYSIYKKPSFETEIEYSISFLEEESSQEIQINRLNKLLYDNFYSLDLFSDWEKNTDDKTLKFEEIKNTTNINGLIVKKNNEENLIEFKSTEINNKIKTFIILRTNQADLIKSIYNYFEFVNSFITNIYHEELLANLIIASDLYEENTLGQTNLDLEILNIKKKLNEIKKGKLIISLNPPNLPKIVSTPRSIMLFFSVIIGFLVSLIIIYLFRFSEIVKLELGKK